MQNIGGNNMETTKDQPKNYEEWKHSAPIEELVQGLYERHEEANKTIVELLKKQATLTENRNMLYTMLQSHQHDTNGNVMLPAGFVKFAED